MLAREQEIEPTRITSLRMAITISTKIVLSKNYINKGQNP
jgi:hypothetical protein